MVTLVVEYLGSDDYHFGHSAIRLFLPGRGELGRIGWVAVCDGGTSKSMSTQAHDHQPGPLFIYIALNNS